MFVRAELHCRDSNRTRPTTLNLSTEAGTQIEIDQNEYGTRSLTSQAEILKNTNILQS